ncbi:MAG: hypothetical protein COB53_04810 [Elusimicrobia bacterium]|nr:MAG: hypothetical protein COB53_04810 [Elusimicrobiota bacterium]
MNVAVCETVILGAFAAGVLHVVVWRVRPSNDPRIGLLCLLGGFGWAFAVGLYVVRWGGDRVAVAAVTFDFIFLIIAYLFFYAGLSRSVSITLLGQLLQAPDQQIGFDVLAGAYEKSDRFDDRIRLLNNLNLVEISGENIRLSGRGKVLTDTARGLCGLLGGTIEG